MSIPCSTSRGAPQQAGDRLPGLQGDGMDRAFAGSTDRIESQQGAGGHDDLAASLPGEFDQVGRVEECAGAEDDQTPAPLQRRLGNRTQQLRGRALDHPVAALGE